MSMEDKVIIKQKNGDVYSDILLETTTDAVLLEDKDYTLTNKLNEVIENRFPYTHQITTTSDMVGIANSMCPCGDGWVACGDGWIQYSWDAVTWYDIEPASSTARRKIEDGHWISCSSDIENGGACIVIGDNYSLMTSNTKTPPFLCWDFVGAEQYVLDENIIIIPRLSATTTTPKAYDYSMVYGLGGRPPCTSRYNDRFEPTVQELPRQIIMTEGKAIMLTERGSLTYSENTEVNGLKSVRYDPDIPAEDIKDDATVKNELEKGLQYTMWHYPIKQWPKSEAECWYRRWQLIYTGDKPDYEKWPFKPGDHNYRWFRTTLGSIAGKKPDNTRYKYISANPAFIDNTGMAAIPVVMCATNGKIKIFNFGTTYRDDPEGKLDMFDDDIFREYMYTTDFTAQFKPVKRPLPRIDSRNPEARDNSAFYMHSDGGPVLIKMSTNTSKFAVTQMQFNGEFIDIYEVIHNGFGYVFATNKGIFFNREFVGSDVTSYNSFKWYNMPTYPECSADVKMTCNGSKVVIYDPTWECTMTIEPPNGEV